MTVCGLGLIDSVMYYALNRLLVRYAEDKGVSIPANLTAQDLDVETVTDNIMGYLLDDKGVDFYADLFPGARWVKKDFKKLAVMPGDIRNLCVGKTTYCVQSKQWLLLPAAIDHRSNKTPSCCCCCWGKVL